MNHAHAYALLGEGLRGSTPVRHVPRFDTTGAAIVAPWLSLADFAYERLDDEGAIVRLMASLDADRAFPTDVALLVQRRRALTRRLAPLSSSAPVHCAERWALGEPGSLLWEVSFDLPLEVVQSPRSLFTLSASNRVALALPAPRLREDLAAAATGRDEPRFVLARVRRHAIAFTAGLAVAAGTGSAGGAALAGTVASTDTTATVTTTATTDTTTTTPTDTTTTPTTTTPTSTTPTTTVSTDTTTTPPATTPAPATTTPVATTTPATTNTTISPPASTTTVPGNAGTSTSPGTLAPPRTTASGHGSHNSTDTKHLLGSGGKDRALGGAQGRREHRGHGNGTLRKHKSKRHHRASTHAPASIPNTPVLAITPASYTLDPFTALQISRLSSLIGATNQPPAFLIPIYKAAGRRYHVPWQILAAINAVETDFGRNLNVSSAGAIGWMQFMPATWLEYGMDVVRHGRRMIVNAQGQPNPYDPTDAIFAAAHYLAANGAPHNIRKAIFAYNHALWYVDAVLWRAQTISDKAFFGLHQTGYSLPLDARYMRQLGRIDDGVDIETAPDGAAVYSITPGVVTAVASDPSGFGPNYPVVLATKGPLQGQYIYYGHVAASLVKVGQHVIAGQPIAVMGHAGNAASLGHGHIEIGFSDGSGTPLNHGLASAAWTPSGDAMRSVLIAVTRAFDRARSASAHAHAVRALQPRVIRNHARAAHAEILSVPSRILKRP